MSSLSSIVTVYQKIRAKKAELKREEKELTAQLKQLEVAILEKLSEEDVESVRTKDGTAYKSTVERFGIKDWDLFVTYINQNPHQIELLSKRVSSTAMRAFMEEHSDELPPGIERSTELTANVRSR